MAATAALLNSLATREQLERPPTVADGVSPELEYDLRIWGSLFIEQCGVLLKLPQVAIGTGQVLLHRFYCRRSMVKFGVESVAMAAIYLAAKLEECPRRARDVVNVGHYLAVTRQGLPYEPMDFYGTKFDEMKSELVVTEKQILKNLGFMVNVQHPHKLIISMLAVLGAVDSPMLQQAWNYMNDSFRTNVFVRYQTNVIAAAVILLAARTTGHALPLSPPWWTLLEATLPEMEDVCRHILYSYTRPLPADLPTRADQLAAYLAAHPPVQSS